MFVEVDRKKDAGRYWVMGTARMWVIIERENQSGGEDIAHHNLCTVMQKTALHLLSHKEAGEVPSHKLFYGEKEFWEIISL